MAANSKRCFSTRKLVICAMFAACLAVCAQLALPLPIGLPVSLQTFAVMLIGFLLPPVSAAVVVLVYLLLGSVGLPVFAAFQGGLGVLFGPSGGFLWAFLPAVFLMSFVYRLRKSRVVMILAAVLGLLLIYVCGLWQFSFVTGLGIAEVLLTVCLPCLPGEVLKLVLAVVLVGSLERRGFVF